MLYHHLNHEENRPLLPHLLPRLAAAGASPAGPPAGGPAGAGGQAALRLLRLLCASCFRPEWYTGRARISSAVGAYSTVYRACLPAWAGERALQRTARAPAGRLLIALVYPFLLKARVPAACLGWMASCRASPPPRRYQAAPQPVIAPCLLLSATLAAAGKGRVGPDPLDA